MLRRTNHFDHTNDRLTSTLDHPSCFSCRFLGRNRILLLYESDASVWVLELVAVVVAQLERKVEAVVVQMDHLEDLGNIDAFDNLLEAPLGVECHVFRVGSEIKQAR
jgi:hypothetical protein